jgi:hypothetical protein
VVTIGREQKHSFRRPGSCVRSKAEISTGIQNHIFLIKNSDVGVIVIIVFLSISITIKLPVTGIKTVHSNKMKATQPT